MPYCSSCRSVCLITGNGNFIEGSGSTSVLWSVLAALAVCWILALQGNQISLDELMRVFLKGAGDFLPIAVILLFALALGDVAGALGAGSYAATLVGDNVNTTLLLPILFLLRVLLHSLLVLVGDFRDYDTNSTSNCFRARSTDIAFSWWRCSRGLCSVITHPLLVIQRLFHH